MDKQTENDNVKYIHKVFIGILLANIGGVILIFLLILFYIYPDYFIYWNTSKIHSKEEMFQFVIEKQEYLEQAVEDMQEVYVNNNEKMVKVDHYDVMDKVSVNSKSVNKLLKFSIHYISMCKWEKTWYLKCSFAYAPSGYDYWGIYYMPTGNPKTWEIGEMEEENGVYTQRGSYYRYETEHITGNWYYYQCDTR